MKTQRSPSPAGHLDSGHEDAVGRLHHVLEEILQLLLLVLPSYTQLSDREVKGHTTTQTAHAAGTSRTDCPEENHRVLPEILSYCAAGSEDHVKNI